MTSDLYIWVIYDNLVDLPGRYVARKWLLDRPTAELIQGRSLEEVREKLPKGLVRFARDESDDPKIIESWI